MNFVILDYDDHEDLDFATDLGVRSHPAYGLVAPNSDKVVARIFGPQTDKALRGALDDLVADYGSPETQ